MLTQVNDTIRFQPCFSPVWDVLRVAKELVAFEEVIASRSAYYSNSGLDMGQYDETKSASVQVVLEASGEVSAYANYLRYGGMGADVKENDERNFGSVQVRDLGKIDAWANAWFDRFDMSKDAKKGWTKGDSGRGRRVSLAKAIQDLIQQDD